VISQNKGWLKPRVSRLGKPKGVFINDDSSVVGHHVDRIFCQMNERPPTSLLVQP